MALWMEETEPTWKKQRRSWRDQTLSLPPPSLLLLFCIVLLLLSLSAHNALRSDDARLSTRFVAHLAMAAAPVLLIFFAVRWMLVNGRSSLRRVPVMMMSPDGAGGSPWGVAAAVVLLLVLVSYQSRFLSQWSGPL
ncbi:hypothetical protein QJS10_CPA01g02372 [Acorus calamus]|uniref:Uncharacterized protein n=1 Tax=Acorus calamus TaxID=4465 RepID=A0AAV9FQT6_ACOCL|nr:hypothetical protein QJS10_CPA01g02372 [Acorus calamus]